MKRSVALLLALAAWLSPIAYAASKSDVVVSSIVGDAEHWTATNWTPEDKALFEGIPVYDGDHKDLILLRYSYYVSDYDADRLCPLWVAHVDVGDTTQKAKDRADKKGPDEWDRIKFYPDRNVIKFSNSRHLPYVIDGCYTKPNPEGFPDGEKGREHITRGHNASNEEMKLEGDEAQGVRSQHESFSLANISPETQGHNNPIWFHLESACLKWAAKLGRVAVITGPMFTPDPKLPMPVNKIIYTHGTKGPQIPIPTHFFKIIIGEIDGKLAAIGFIVPHLSHLAGDDFLKYQFPIETIEKMTNIRFLPNVSPNSAVKTKVDARWEAMLGLQ